MTETAEAKDLEQVLEMNRQLVVTQIVLFRTVLRRVNRITRTLGVLTVLLSLLLGFVTILLVLRI